MSCLEKQRIDIGVLEKTDPWKLKSNFFPSKVGGKPAWLDLENIPGSSDLMCGICKNPVTFLCQIYAPIEDDPNAFHRTLYVFVCKTGTCCGPNQADNIIILRCQLKRDNVFYSFEPPVEDENKAFDMSKWPHVCRICGLKAPSHCSKCKNVNYCHRLHQVHDWKNGHKQECEKWSEQAEKQTLLKIHDAQNAITFPEWELVMEDEFENDGNKTVSTAQELEKFQKLLADKKAGTFQDIPESDIEPYASAPEDKIFHKFNKAVTNCPDQVLRYSRGGTPLWITGNPNPPIVNALVCEYCGSKREYEFQIMPQLLNFLDMKPGINSIDWGVLIVYTCSKNCDIGPHYKNEFVYKQDIV